MENKNFVGRALKLGGSAGCGFAALLCAWGAGWTKDPRWYVVAAGCATGSFVMAKQAILGYKEEK